MIEIIRCHTQLNYANEYLRKPLSLSISIIFPATPPSFPRLALRVSCISLPICVQLREAQSSRAFSRSHNRFESFCAYRVNSSQLRLGHVISQASKSIIFFFLSDQGKPPMSSLHLSPKHTVIFSLSLPTLSHLSLSVSPSPYLALILSISPFLSLSQFFLLSSPPGSLVKLYRELTNESNELSTQENLWTKLLVCNN